MTRLTIEEDSSVGDNLVAEVVHDGTMQITVEEPWAGDTQTGIGREASIRLSKAQALSLAGFLMEYAESKT